MYQAAVCNEKKGNEILIDTGIYFPWQSRFGQIKKTTAVRIFLYGKSFVPSITECNRLVIDSRGSLNICTTLWLFS